MAVIAFAAIFGTVVTVIDGYAHLCGESVRLLRDHPELARRDKDMWILGITAVALVRGEQDLSPTLRWQSWAGLTFLVGFGLLFQLDLVGALS